MVWEPDWVLSSGWSFLLRLPSSHLLSYFVPCLLSCIWEWDWETWVSWVRLWGAEHPFREIPLNCAPVSCETPLHVPKETRNPDSWVRSSDFENAVTSGGFLAAAVPVQGWHFQTSGFHQRLNTLSLDLFTVPVFFGHFPLYFPVTIGLSIFWAVSLRNVFLLTVFLFLSSFQLHGVLS